MRDIGLADEAAHTGQLWPVCAFISGGGHGAVLPKGCAGFLPAHDHSVVVVEFWGYFYCAPVRQCTTTVVTPFIPSADVCACGYANGSWIELGVANGTFDGGCHHMFQSEVE